MIGLLIGAFLVVASLVYVSAALIEGVRLMPMTFEQWLREVDSILVDLYGIDSGSVEDWLWFDDFDSGLSPREATKDWAAENIITHSYQ